jgi:hypothetical protein
VDAPARRHRLYEEAVQTPEHDVEHLSRLFARRRGREAWTLREDFCGTALLSVRWVQSDDEREAEAIDLDPEVLAYARRHHVGGLDEEETLRLTLLERDVRVLSDRTFDLVVAMNFSWAILGDRELATYLVNARDCLEEDGLLVLELFGGADMARPLCREHRHDGFTYVWEQREVRDGVLDARIHFRLAGGEELRDAFRYRFHLRPLDELRAFLRAAGFDEVELRLEDRRGRYARCAGRPRAPLWRGLLVAGR